MADLPFAYMGVVRMETCGECGQGERYITVRPTLAEVMNDRVLRIRAKWPEENWKHGLEIIEVYRSGRQESLPLNCYADSPRGRAIHWRWRDQP